ncbi:MAG TPA: glycosyltransferase [Phycisphaerales bacterium]|nr:glycosyltransferase [Phycisphaerales bacterium]
MPPDRPLLSIVAPAHNEQDNIERLVEEVGRAGGNVANKLGNRNAFEFILIDDGSTDLTRLRAMELAEARPWFRVIAMTNTPEGRGNGQSAAFYAGFRACRADLVALLDADLQNDPSDLVAMLDLMRRENADMVQGDRSANRQDNFIRRVGSRIGRLFRGLILGDSIRDTGCSLRLMKREIALRLPLEFKGVHRFIPVTARQMGYKVVEMTVSHRPRVAGETKYGMGVLPRALPGLIDCFAIRWMSTRRRPVSSMDLTDARPDLPRPAPGPPSAISGGPR